MQLWIDCWNLPQLISTIQNPPSNSLEINLSRSNHSHGNTWTHTHLNKERYICQDDRMRSVSEKVSILFWIWTQWREDSVSTVMPIMHHIRYFRTGAWQGRKNLKYLACLYRFQFNSLRVRPFQKKAGAPGSCLTKRHIHGTVVVVPVVDVITGFLSNHSKFRSDFDR
jgi:hypothetical protein